MLNHHYHYFCKLKAPAAACMLLLLMMLPVKYSSAQNLVLKGTVLDTSGTDPLPYAVVMVVKINDSVLTAFTRSDKSGFFEMKTLPVDTYQVVISHPRFGDQTFILIGDKQNPEVDLKKITLPPKSVTLSEVTIVGYKDAVFYNGDTLVYRADSFKVKKNAVVEDLLKKLPGIKVEKDGKIYSQGKEVNQVLVDGDEFFGSDPTTATKNLNASSVETVEVYDKKNDNPTEGKDDETLKVMNLKLKEDAKKGYFGKATAATDFKNFYEGDLLFNHFSGKQKISLFAIGTNTPRGNFGWSDMYKYGLNNEMNMYSEDDMSYYYYNNDRPSGIPRSFKTGFYYNDMISKKTKVTLNYSYGTTSLHQQSTTTSQYFLPDTSYRSQRFFDSHQDGMNHSANLTIHHNLDSLREIEIQSKLKKNSSDQLQFDNMTFLSNTGELKRRTETSNDNSGDSYDWNNSVKLTNRFRKKDRLLEVNYSNSMSNNESNGILKSTDQYLNSTVPDSIINQKKTGNTTNQTNQGSVTYTEPLSKKLKLEFSYDVSISDGTQKKQTLDYTGSDYTTENSLLSNNFKSNRSVNRTGVKFTYETKKQRLSLGSRVREVDASSVNMMTQQKISQEVKNVLPYMSYRYKFTDNQNLNFSYSTKSSQPSLNQLQPVPDNSNPNYVTKGNPDLLPTYSHSFNLNFYAFKPITGKNMWSSVNFTTTNNAFASMTSYDSVGRKISQPVNVDGNYNGSAYLNYTWPLFSKMLEVDPSGDFSFNNSVNFVNGFKNVTKQTNSRLGLDLRLKLDTLEFSVGGSYSYQNSTASLSDVSNQYSYSSNYDASFEMEFPWKLKLETDAEYERNSKRAAGYNIHYVLWNASISKTLFKNENVILSIEGKDLLNQNIDLVRTINDNVITDTKTTIISRYILFRVLFKINSKKEKEEDDF